MIVSEERKDVRPGVGPALAESDGASTPPPVPTIPTREAMSWIRALANDWEDGRSRPPFEK